MAASGPVHTGDVPSPRGEEEAAARALAQLVEELGSCIEQLNQARSRAVELLEQRRRGQSWLQIVSAEERPLVVERVSSVMATLAHAGGSFRRNEARALVGEQVSINRIAALFGVTRQRISTLLREPSDDRGVE